MPKIRREDVKPREEQNLPGVTQRNRPTPLQHASPPQLSRQIRLGGGQGHFKGKCTSELLPFGGGRGLSVFLSCALRCATDHNVDNTTAMLREWLAAVGRDYAAVVWKPEEEAR